MDSDKKPCPDGKGRGLAVNVSPHPNAPMLIHCKTCGGTGEILLQDAKNYIEERADNGNS